MAIRDNWVFRRGDLYMANLNPYRGSEQGGTRPVLVLQNNDGNFYCPTLIVAPLTTKIKKENLPTHIRIERTRGLPEPSMAELEQIRTIDKMRIQRYLGRISREKMSEIDDAIYCSLGLRIPECVEAP